VNRIGAFNLAGHVDALFYCYVYIFVCMMEVSVAKNISIRYNNALVVLPLAFPVYSFFCLWCNTLIWRPWRGLYRANCKPFVTV